MIKFEGDASASASSLPLGVETAALTSHILNNQRSAFTTLGLTIGDVGAWLFLIWVCINWFLNLCTQEESIMKATFKTSLEALAVLWA